MPQSLLLFVQKGDLYGGRASPALTKHARGKGLRPFPRWDNVSRSYLLHLLLRVQHNIVLKTSFLDS